MTQGDSWLPFLPMTCRAVVLSPTSFFPRWPAGLPVDVRPLLPHRCLGPSDLTLGL
jgi:hypothetical protein